VATPPRNAASTSVLVTPPTTERILVAWNSSISPDYFIRVQVADAASYEQWLTTQLLGDPAIIRVDSRITMNLVKSQR
jgi:hypothetical protein